VIVEVGSTWLVLGVAPGRVSPWPRSRARRFPTACRQGLRRNLNSGMAATLHAPGAEMSASLLLLILLPALALAQAMPAVTSTPAAGGGTQWSLSIQTLLLLTSLSFLPAMVLMMTSFTRIIIVFPCCAMHSAPRPRRPTRCWSGWPVPHLLHHGAGGDKIYTEAYLPLSENRISFNEALERGAVPLEGLHAEAGARGRPRPVYQASPSAEGRTRPRTCRCAC
jgi:hypothetical protein